MGKVQININLASQGAIRRCEGSVGKFYSYQAVHWLQVVLTEPVKNYSADFFR